MADWYYTTGGQRIGPVDERQLRQVAASGGLQGADLVWRQGMADWIPASAVPELRTAAGASAYPGMQGQPMETQLNYPSAQAVGFASPNLAAPALTGEAVMMLRATKPWVRFISILMFIGIALALIFGIVSIYGVTSITSSSRSRPGYREGYILGQFFAMIVVPGLLIIPAVYLNNFASRIDALVTTRRSTDLEAALRSQKSYWKFTGIFTLVMLCIYGLLLLVLFSGLMRM